MTSSLAITALVLSLLPCFSPVGLVVGIIALVKLKDETETGRGLAIAAIVLSVLLPAAEMASINPNFINFIRFQARSKQSECKSNLGALYTAERAYFQKHGVYSDDVEAIGFGPSPPRRYAYFLSAEGPFYAGPNNPGEGGFHGYLSDMTKVSPADAPPEVAETIGARGECPACEFTAACVGQIDSDKTLDVWLVSSREGIDRYGREPAGQPYNLVNDVNE